MQIRMTNPPSFMEVLGKTPGPELFENSYKDVTDKGSLIIATGLIAMLGAYFMIGLASVPAGLLLVGLTYTVLKVQRAMRKHTRIQQALNALNASARTTVVDPISLTKRMEQIKEIKDDSERLKAFDAISKEMKSKLEANTTLDGKKAVSKLKSLWEEAQFQKRSCESQDWEEYIQDIYYL